MSTAGSEQTPPRPIHTRRELAQALTALGVQRGDTLLVHSSLKASGPRPRASTPSALLARAWARSRSRCGPGRKPGGSHPQTSFAALGPRSAEVVAVHDLDSQCGERSPLATLERLGTKVLLLGAGFGSCTAFHLAEYRVAGSPRTTHGAAVLTADGGQEWVTFDDLDLDEDDFEEIGTHLRSLGAVATGKVGEADSHLVDLTTGVEAARAWMVGHRRPDGGAPAGS